MKPSEPLLNVARWQSRSTANGPGERFVLWVQGCPILCPGCVNDDFLARETRQLVSVTEMAERILAVPDLEGVTFSGGEPTMQAQALARLCGPLRQAGLSVVCYSGYTLEALQQRRDEWTDQLLAQVDILIDGPFVREQAAELLWRGSRNQRVLFLTDRYRQLAEGLDERPARVEFTIGRDGFATTGIWPAGFLERLEEALRK